MPLWSINTIVALLSFVIAAAFGKALIPFLHKLKFGQPIKMKFGPEWHAKKQGTPTMGGILFILSTTVAVGVGYGRILPHLCRSPDTVHNQRRPQPLWRE